MSSESSKFFGVAVFFLFLLYFTESIEAKVCGLVLVFIFGIGGLIYTYKEYKAKKQA